MPNQEYSGALGRVDVFQHANSAYKGVHQAEIFDEEKGSIVTCTCGMRIAMLHSGAEKFADNHEFYFNRDKTY